MAMWKQLVLALLVLTGAIFAWISYFPAAASYLGQFGISVASVDVPKPEEGPRGGRPPPPIVFGAPVSQGVINNSVTAIGDGMAARSVTVTPYAAGHVVAIAVSSGQRVEVGDVLVELDSQSEQIALDRARLDLEDAREGQKRSEQLRQSNAISDVQLRADVLATGQAELAERDAALALERRAIRAPFAGSVGIVSVDIGDQVEPGDAIVTLDDRAHILVDFQVPERVIGQLALGAPVNARPLATPGRAITGELAAIDSRISASSRMLRLRASFDNAEDRLRPGMAFDIGMKFAGDSYPAVSPLAIQWNAEGAYVWTARDGKATMVPVHIIQRGNDMVLVDADLAPGQMVVTEGVQMLRPGAPFRFEQTPPDSPGADGGAPDIAAAPAALRE